MDSITSSIRLWRIASCSDTDSSETASSRGSMSTKPIVRTSRGSSRLVAAITRAGTPNPCSASHASAEKSANVLPSLSDSREERDDHALNLQTSRSSRLIAAGSSRSSQT